MILPFTHGKTAPQLTCPWLQWLLVFLLLTPLASYAQVNEGLVPDSTELRVLHEFYLATGGDNWSDRTNWPTSQAWPATATSADFGTWTGVGVTNGDVTLLYRNSVNLQGSLPASLGLLTSLTYLTLVNSPGLTGPLPQNLGQLRQLYYLRFTRSPVTGALPPSLAQLTNLQYLYLDDTQLSGTLPAWVGGFPRLQILALGNSAFSGPLPPELGNLAQMQSLELGNGAGIQPGQGNAFSGSIPPELGKLTQLQRLDLSLNPITGSLPPELGQLRNLYFLELDGCHLSGPVPAAITQLPQLRTLLLGYPPYPAYPDHNAFTSLPVPSAWADLPHAGLRLEDNQFEFGSLEPYFSGPGQPIPSFFTYLPQTLPQDARTVRAEVGESVRLSSAIGGTRTHYQWQRQVGGSWVSLTSASATTATYQLAAAALADAGPYRCQATNDWVTNLTLTTRVYTLDVQATGPRNRPDDTNRGLALVTPPPAPDAAASQPADLNYVRTWIPRVPLRAAPGQDAASQCTATGQILREQWSGVDGTLVSQIPLSTLPGSFTYLSALEGPTNLGDSYGDRIRGYLCPPQTGTYTFWIAGDDNSELWLSTDADPAHKVHLATVPGYTDPRQWDKYAEQKSALISLVQGQRYYVEVLHKEGGGGDNVAVAWQLPDGTIEGPISGSHLSPASAPSLATAAVLREEWDGVDGTLVSQIPLSTPPTSQGYLPTLEGPTNSGDSYGDRMRAYLTAPQTGTYTFWIAGDDNSELWLSTDADPAHKVHLATVPGYTDPRQWDKYAEQKSALISLVQGQRYYVEVLHKEGGGGDNVAVAWQLPDGTIEGPISGSHLSAIPLPAPGLVRRAQWDNVSGLTVADIPLGTAPTHTGYVATLETAPGLGNNYGAQLSAYLTAPQTGSYTFWVAGDDAAELWLSPDADSSHQVRRAYAPGATAFRQWDSTPSQQSAAVALVAGQRYYVRVLHKQGGGGDHVSVKWQLPDGTSEGPIARPHLAPTGPSLTVRAAGSTGAGSSRWTVDSAQITTQYLDGLGRPVQTVLHQASPRRRDLVQPQAYDALGREPKQYLPYPDSLQGHGGYRYQALSQQQQFYANTGGTGPPAPDDPTRGVARTGVAFAETRFEASPLNRVLAQGAAGEAWQLTDQPGTGHFQQRLERPNLASDSVPNFQLSPAPRYRGSYPDGELWGTQTTDEHGGRSLEWKDKLGHVVLKQVETRPSAANSTATPRWLRTAYVYDDFERLQVVVQPEGTKRIFVGAAPLTVAPFLFHYRYDGRGRQIAKQVPGQDGETVVVYDQLDRPVLSQDAQQRTRKEWSWTKYDALGRLVMSGLVTRQDTLGQVSLQAVASADTAASHQYEQRSAGAQPHYYTTTQAYPQLGQNGFGTGQVLSATYYDDYDFDNNGQPDLAYDPGTDSQFPAGQAPVADALRTTGLTTRTKTRVLGVAEGDATQAAWLTTTTFYDERARPVQVQTTNARQGTDLLTTQLDFTGKVVQSVARHQGPNLATPLQVAEFFTYDHLNRLLTTRQQLPGEAHAALLDSVQYNEIGQATRKTLATGRLKQEVDYTYNIRGWLTRLNDPFSPNASDLFNLSLHYETGFTKGYEQYNGNLTGQTWRGRDGVQRAYGYGYDPLNRLLQGDFVARAGGSTGTLTTATAWNTESDNYRLSSVSYDDNGNVNTLRRQGLLKSATHNAAKQYGAVDNLSYAYVGNRLQVVDDAVTGNQLAKSTTYHGAPTSLAGDFQEASVHLSQEYLYDANGNLTQDKNKGITGIVYNHLNLPRQIHFGQVGDSVVFRYAASGQKVAKLVYQTGKPIPQRTDYLGPYQYEQDSLKFFPHAEGRVLRFVQYDAAGQVTVSYQREYTLKDHLGNLRLAYRAGQVRTLTATLEQDDHTRKRETQQFDSLSVSPPVAVATSLAHSGTYAARLNASGNAPQPLGPLTQLGVQKGDTVIVTAFGYYAQAQQHGFFFSLASFIASILHPAQPAPVGLEANKRKDLPLLQVGLSAGLAFLPQLAGGVPQGYLRLLVFDQDSALVDQQVQALTQAARGGYEPLRLQLVLPQDGYVTTYVGNESDVDVYFDDVSVEHRPGLQVQETQYDPAGLELAGLAAPSPGIRGLNNYRFNGKEFQADLGLAWNHQDWRFFDPQILRWHVGDPELENGQESWTPYSFGYDNAVRYADANGRCPCEGDIAASIQSTVDFTAGLAGALIDNTLGTHLSSSHSRAGNSGFESGQVAGHRATAIVGAYLTASGAVDVAAGGGMLASAGGLELATLGAGSEVAGPMAVQGAELAAIGGLKVAAGTWLMSNANSNLQSQGAANQSSGKGGGAYKDLSVENGQHRHHMPANAASPLSKGRGPSIVMEGADHKMTASFGSSRQAKAYRALQKKMIDAGNPNGAMKMDIKDVMSKFGDKYNTQIGEARKYFRSL